MRGSRKLREGTCHPNTGRCRDAAGAHGIASEAPGGLGALTPAGRGIYFLGELVKYAMNKHPQGLRQLPEAFPQGTPWHRPHPPRCPLIPPSDAK